MKLSQLVFGALIVLLLTVPLVLYYFAFYSGSGAFKDSVNNHVEFYYFLFMITGITLATIVTKYFIDPNNIRKDKKDMVIFLLKIIVISYGIFLVLNSTSRYITYKSEGIDVMFFKAEIWQLSAFQIPTLAWSQHFSPILIFLVPLFWMFKSGTMLMFVQVAAVVSGGIPLYLISKEKLHSPFLGLAIATSYLTFGGLQFGYAYGFHEIMFLPPLFFWMYYFLLKRRIKLYFLFVFLCLLVKEEVSFIMIFFGLYLLFKKNYRYAIGTLIFGVVWYIICFSFIFPYFTHGQGYGYWGQYPNANKGVLGLVYFAIFHPVQFITTLVTPKYKLDMLLHTFGNFSFLSFLYPPSLIIVIPSLLQKLLSDNIAAKNGFHYSSAITAVVLISVIESIFSVQRKEILTKFVKNKNTFLGLLIFYVAGSANILYGYHQLSPLCLGMEGGLTDQQLLVLNQTINAIPPNATVAAQYYIHSHINKPYWQTSDGPLENETADYAIVHANLPFVMTEKELLENTVTKLFKEGKYEPIVNSYGTILLKRK